MKKRLLAAAVAATITLSVGVAMAAPVEFDGSASVHYRWDDNKAGNSVESGKSTFLLNANLALDEKTTFYTRFAAQAWGDESYSADFNTDHYGKSVATMDRFGVIYKADNAKFNLGRQGATVGATALLFSTEGYIGTDMGSIDGLTASAKLGATQIGLVAGEESDNHNKVYSIHGGFNPSKAVTVGATLAQYDRELGDATNYWAVDASYGIGKATVFGEYAKSDENTKNKAYALGTSYAFDSKNSFAAIYNNVEANADMNGWTDFDPNGKGMYYSYNHKLTKNTTLNVFYKDMEVSDNSKVDYNSFRTTVTYKF